MRKLVSSLVRNQSRNLRLLGYFSEKYEKTVFGQYVEFFLPAPSTQC